MSLTVHRLLDPEEYDLDEEEGLLCEARNREGSFPVPLSEVETPWGTASWSGTTATGSGTSGEAEGDAMAKEKPKPKSPFSAAGASSRCAPGTMNISMRRSQHSSSSRQRKWLVPIRVRTGADRLPNDKGREGNPAWSSPGKEGTALTALR